MSDTWGSISDKYAGNSTSSGRHVGLWCSVVLLVSVVAVADGYSNVHECDSSGTFCKCAIKPVSYSRPVANKDKGNEYSLQTHQAALTMTQVIDLWHE